MGKPIGAIFRKHCSYAVRSGIKFSGAPLVEESGSAKGPGERAEPRLRDGAGSGSGLASGGSSHPFLPPVINMKNISGCFCAQPRKTLLRWHPVAAAGRPFPPAPSGTRTRGALPALLTRQRRGSRGRGCRRPPPPAAVARPPASGPGAAPSLRESPHAGPAPAPPPSAGTAARARPAAAGRAARGDAAASARRDTPGGVRAWFRVVKKGAGKGHRTKSLQ